MTLNVVDVSSNNPIQAAITPGADGCIVKATQGTTYINPSCDAQYQLAKAHGMKLGVYHYASGGDAIAEAEFFYQNIKGYLYEAILVLDWEEAQNDNYEDCTWCRKFVNRIHELTGVWCIIYGNRQDINRCTNLADTCGLWFAGYPTDTECNWNAPEFTYNIAPWQTMVGWQYAAADVDRSKFYVTKEQWDKYANPTSNPNPTPPVPPAPKRRYGYRVDDLQYINGLWQVKNDVLGQPDFDWTENGINVAYIDKINPATGENTANQTLKVGDYFSFQPSSVGIITEQHPLNGKTISHVQFPNEFIWLYTESVEKLIYG